MLTSSYAFFDVAVNLTDCVFRGIDWKGRVVHQEDFDCVIRRAQAIGVKKILVSGTNLEQCVRAVGLCRQYPGFLFCTVGVHPAHCAEFLTPLSLDSLNVVPTKVTIDPPKGIPRDLPSKEEEENNACERLNQLKKLIVDNRDVVIAVGEIGLDGAELQYCPMDIQAKYFRRQLEELVSPLKLPMFLHSRDCGMYFADIMSEYTLQESQKEHAPCGGVVHSFNGGKQELVTLLGLGYYIGINASAFRSEESSRLSCEIPLNRLMLETDAPWCDAWKADFGFPFIQTHFDSIKRSGKFVLGKCVERRNEPCHMIQVLEEYHGVRSQVCKFDESKEEIADAVFRNCNRLFFGE